MNKSVCYFGSYKKDYPRNLLTQKAFKELGWNVIECHDDNGGIKHYTKLIRMFKKDGKKAGLIFIGVLGHYDVPLAWILAKIFNKKIIFDAFYPLYDSYVNDRKSIKRFSLTALRMYLYDLFSINMADRVLLDTKENIDYYRRHYWCSTRKFYELPVSADPLIFNSFKPKRHKIFTVGFYGSYLPLHGVETIVNAFGLISASNYKLLLLGSGPGLNQIKQKVKKMGLKKSVKFLPNTPYHNLPKFYKKIDIFLGGPFGDTEKAKRVVPAKVVESIALGVKTIIVDTPANKRLISKKMPGVYWTTNNTQDLANLIVKLQKKKNTNSVGTNYLDKTVLGYNSFHDRLEKIIDITLQKK